MWLLLLVACPLPDEGPASSLFEGPTATLRIDHSPFDLQVWVEGELRARLAPDGLSIGEVPDQEEDFNFDPYNLVAEDMVYARPTGLEWRSVDRAHPVGDAFALFSEDEFVGSLYVDGERVEVATRPDAPYIRIAMEAQEEGYYGLGEHFDAVELTGLPVLITENGIGTDDDTRRTEYLRRALASLKECLDDGLDVRGYCQWSLLDNFEWMLGYRPTFGIVAVDRATQVRTPKPSAAGAPHASLRPPLPFATSAVEHVLVR